jgi:erythromycin esterase
VEDGGVRAVFGDATVVGIGVPTHGAHELTELVAQVVRTLVEQLGFRALAMDESPAIGARLDRYVRTGDGDPRALVAELTPHHRTEEILTVVRWMRSYAELHPDDPVRFVGVDVDADEEVPGGDPIGYLEPRLAENVLLWHDEMGAKVVFWSGCTHTAVGAARTVAFPPAPPKTHRNAGSHLRSQLGDRYRSVLVTFHQGTVDAGAGVVDAPSPAPEFVESTLDRVCGPGPSLVDLRGDVPDELRTQLAAPATLRLVGPRADPDGALATMTGGSLGDWFDAVAFVREVGPVRFHA